MELEDFAAFENLNETQIDNIRSACDERKIPAGEMLMRRGEEGGDLYFLLDGELLVYIDQGGREVELVRLSAPAVVGELELLTGQSRTANVRALTDTRVMVAPGDRIGQRLDDGDPASLKVMLAIARLIAGRLTSMTEKFIELESTAEPSRSRELSDFRKKLFSEWTF